jgi:hypothetical protein
MPRRRPAYRRRNPSVRLDPRERRRNPIRLCGPGALSSSFPRKRPPGYAISRPSQAEPGGSDFSLLPPIEARGRLWVPASPLAGLGPAIHAFLPVGGVDGEDVGGRNKSGHGEVKLGDWKGIRSRATKISPDSPALARGRRICGPRDFLTASNPSLDPGYVGFFVRETDDPVGGGPPPRGRCAAAVVSCDTKTPPSLRPAGFLVAVADLRFLIETTHGDVPPVERQR